MRSIRCPRFEKEYKRLTKELQKRTDNALERFEINPYRNSLRFKQVAPNLYSICVSHKYRILGILKETLEDREIVWYWVGPHHQYDKQILKYRRSR